MLDTIRAYCLEQLAEAGEENGVRDRMCGYYLALAETADPLLRSPAQRHWFGVLAAENGNMHEALRLAIDRRDAGTALRFGAALAWYWYVCCQRGERGALARAVLALDAAGSRRGDRATAEARCVCAVIAASADGDLDLAMELVDAAVAAAAADPGGPMLHPLVIYARTETPRLNDDGEHALELLADYLSSADPWIGAAAGVQSAIILRGLGRLEEASGVCDAALTAFREIEENWGTAATLMLRAELDKTAGDYRGAIAALEEAIACGRQLGAPNNDMTWVYSDLAWLRVRTGDYAAAHAALGLADQNARARADPDSYLHLIRAELAWREGQLAEAIGLCEDILSEAAGSPASWVPLRALAGARLGVLTLEAGDITRGTALLRDALGAAAAAGDRPAAAAAVEGLAAAALRAAGAERAAVLLGAADSIRGAVDHSSLDAPAVRAAAKEQLSEASFDAAYSRGLGMPYDEALGFVKARAGHLAGTQSTWSGPSQRKVH